MSALARLERFGEEYLVFLNWRSCRLSLQNEWPLWRFWMNTKLILNYQGINQTHSDVPYSINKKLVEHFFMEERYLTGLATYSLTDTVKKEAIIILRLVHSSKCWHRPKEINDRREKTERKKSFVWRHNNGSKVSLKEYSNDSCFQEIFMKDIN